MKKERETLKGVYEFCNSATTDISWERGGKGSFSPIFRSITDKGFFWIYSNGDIQLYFGRLSDSNEGKNYKTRFIEGLSKMSGFQHIDFSGYAPMAGKKWLENTEDFKTLLRTLVNPNSPT